MCSACLEGQGLKTEVSKFVKLLCVRFISRFLCGDGERGNKAYLCSEVKHRVCWELRVLKGQEKGSGEVTAKLK